MEYYIISFPGEFGQCINETWSTEQILQSYYPYWKEKMESVGKHEEISEDNCIEDWCIIHWAVKTEHPFYRNRFYNKKNI